MTVSIILLYLMVGLLAGFLAGLLGIGGGIIIVPILSIVFTLQGFNDNFIMRSALATSMASILVTSIVSVRAHARLKNVYWKVILTVAPGILLGAIIGTSIASQISTNFLKIFFSCYILFVLIQFLFDFKPNSGRKLPKTLGLLIFGVFLGIITILTGIGGGTLIIPFLLWCNIEMRKAVGTSSGMGFPIALFGVSGYIYYGLTTGVNLPELTLGYVYLPAAISIASISALVAPQGAKLAQKLSNKTLKRLFSLLLLVVLIRMVSSLL